MKCLQDPYDEIIERLPTGLENKIIDRVAGFVARCSVNNSLLNVRDLMMLTGRSRNYVVKMTMDRHFPPPIEIVKNSDMRQWRTGDVYRFFEIKQRPW